MNATFIRELKCRLAKPAWWRQYRESLAHDAWTRDRLEDLNWEKRLAILKFAYENSPYYAKLYRDAGLEPGDVKTEADWQRVPMLTREALRQNFETIQVRDAVRHPHKLYTTGGSTGEPSKVLKDDGFSSVPLNWRASVWAGVSCAGNSATIMRTHPKNWLGRLRHVLANFPSVNFQLDAGAMDEAAIAKFVAEWRRYRPQTVTGYVGGVHQIALYCIERGIELPSPTAIFTTAAPLPLAVRKVVSTTFRTPVFDGYVATEAHPMANQCRDLAQEGLELLHIHSDYRHLEFVDERGLCVPDETLGDILVTDLEDRVFPIVRYRLGDRGRRMNRTCTCGRPYPLMDAVRGRMGYKIYLEKGVLTGGWTCLFEKYPEAVHGFQIHQFADKSVRLSVVLNRNYADAKREVGLVAATMQKQLGALPLSVEYVDFIPHDRGKLRYIICDVQE